jgi:hypothetical protein
MPLQAYENEMTVSLKHIVSRNLNFTQNPDDFVGLYYLSIKQLVYCSDIQGRQTKLLFQV